jgi:hypothetical protein
MRSLLHQTYNLQLLFIVLATGSVPLLRSDHSQSLCSLPGYRVHRRACVLKCNTDTRRLLGEDGRESLPEQLERFYLYYDPKRLKTEGDPFIVDFAKSYEGKPERLNDLLKQRYGHDLDDVEMKNAEIFYREYKGSLRAKIQNFYSKIKSSKANDQHFLDVVVDTYQYQEEALHKKLLAKYGKDLNSLSLAKPHTAKAELEGKIYKFYRHFNNKKLMQEPNFAKTVVNPPPHPHPTPLHTSPLTPPSPP